MNETEREARAARMLAESARVLAAYDPDWVVPVGEDWKRAMFAAYALGDFPAVQHLRDKRMATRAHAAARRARESRQ